jgi:hypothetical protein
MAKLAVWVGNTEYWEGGRWRVEGGRDNAAPAADGGGGRRSRFILIFNLTLMLMFMLVQFVHCDNIRVEQHSSGLILRKGSV